MKKCYIKTKNDLYIVSESPTLIILRTKIKINGFYDLPYKSVKSAKDYIKRCNEKPHMKKHLPLSIERREV